MDVEDGDEVDRGAASSVGEGSASQPVVLDDDDDDDDDGGDDDDDGDDDDGDGGRGDFDDDGDGFDDVDAPTAAGGGGGSIRVMRRGVQLKAPVHGTNFGTWCQVAIVRLKASKAEEGLQKAAIYEALMEIKKAFDVAEPLLEDQNPTAIQVLAR